MAGEDPVPASDKPPDNKIIHDAVLTYIVFLMKSKNKNYIAEATIKSFDITLIKRAKERLFRHVYPNEHYAYNGPHKGQPRDKLVHAFDLLFSMLMELDAKDCMPVIACPVSELHHLPSMENDSSIIKNDSRLDKVESTLDWVKAQLESFVLVNAASGIHPRQRQRLNSGAKRHKPDDDDDDDDDISVDSIEVTNPETLLEAIRRDEMPPLPPPVGSFEQPKYNIRKAQKRERHPLVTASRKSWSSLARSAAHKEQPKSTMSKKPPNWGKCTESSELLSGSPPDIFLSHCRRSISDENIKDYFSGKGITITKVQKMSHEDAQWNSFRISVNKYDEFTKIMSGDIIPKEIAVRQYYRARYNAPSKSSAVNHPHNDRHLPSDKVISSTESLMQYISDAPDSIRGSPSRDPRVNKITSAQVNTGSPAAKVTKPADQHE